MSSTTTSTAPVRASAVTRSTASSPSPASPTTTRSGWALTSRRRPERSTAWSSARKTRNPGALPSDTATAYPRRAPERSGGTPIVPPGSRRVLGWNVVAPPALNAAR